MANAIQADVGKIVSLGDTRGIATFQRAIEGTQRNIFKRDEVAGQAVQQLNQLQQDQSVRDVLLDTDKDPADLMYKGVEAEYNVHNKRYEDNIAEINKQTQEAVDATPMFSWREGKKVVNPEYRKLLTTKTTLLDQVEDERSQALGYMNDKVSAAYEGGGMDIIDPIGYSNRVERNLLQAGVNPERAEKIRKDTLEQYKEPEMTDREKMFRKDERAVYTTNSALNALTGNKTRNTEATGSRGAKGTKAGDTAIYSKKYLGDGAKNKKQVNKLLDNASVDETNAIGSGEGQKAVHDLMSNLAVEFPSTYHPKFVEDHIQAAIDDKGSWFYDTTVNIPKLEEKVIKSMQDYAEKHPETVSGNAAGDFKETVTTGLSNATAVTKRQEKLDDEFLGRAPKDTAGTRLDAMFNNRPSISDVGTDIFGRKVQDTPPPPQGGSGGTGTGAGSAEEDVNKVVENASTKDEKVVAKEAKGVLAYAKKHAFVFEDPLHQKMVDNQLKLLSNPYMSFMEKKSIQGELVYDALKSGGKDALKALLEMRINIPRQVANLWRESNPEGSGKERQLPWKTFEDYWNNKPKY